MVGSLFQSFNIHAVIVGADRIAKNGDTANKVCVVRKAKDKMSQKEYNDMLLQIGTYNAAVLAARHRVAFIVVAPTSTVDLEIPDGSQYVPHWPCVANPCVVTNHNRRSIPIEQRPSIEACLVRGAVHPSPLPGSGVTPSQEVVMLTPPNIDLENGIYNPSFDVTPAELITAIVTEKGVAVNIGTGFDLSGVV